jgi:ribonuclease HI
MIAVSNRKRSKNPRTQLIRKLFDQESTKVTLLWVSSHLWILGNETADNSAKEALKFDRMDEKNMNKNYKKNGKTLLQQ